MDSLPNDVAAVRRLAILVAVTSHCSRIDEGDAEEHEHEDDLDYPEGNQDPLEPWRVPASEGSHGGLQRHAADNQATNGRESVSELLCR